MTSIKEQTQRRSRVPVQDAPRASLLFAPEQEGYLISKALYVAQKAILADRHPAYSDAREMMQILETRYPSALKMLRSTENLQKAIKLGFIIKHGQPINDEEVADFISQHETERSRFDLLDPPTFD